VIQYCKVYIKILQGKEVCVVKKLYSAPVVKTESIELGVFGSYGSGGFGGGFKFLPKPRGRKGGWWPWAW
jgi:hypothetical protein